MSNAFAIAAATAVIKSFLTGAVVKASLTGILGTDVFVTAVSPDRIEIGVTDEPNRLNLFMYQVTPNAGWRGVGLPARDGNGARLSNQPLALDLNYMLSAYGITDYDNEILLGVGMQVLHEMPVLTRDAIRNVFTPPPGETLSTKMQALAASGLADQIETIKITPQALNTEELSKLWTAFQGKFRPTAGYQATVALVESKSSLTSSLPVRTRNIYAMPWRRLVIESVSPQLFYPLDNAALTLHGRDLKAPGAVVQFGSGATQTPDAANSTPEKLIVAPPAGLLAGVNTVQVSQSLDLGQPPAPHAGFESNVAAFILAPLVKKKNPTDYDITVQNLTGAGNQPRSADVVVKLKPDVGKRQRVFLLLNELDPPAGRPANSYSFEAPARNAATDTITFAVKNVVKGGYLLRVRVDGAESALEVGADNRYSKPQVSFT